jgi:hypothetical protein
MRVLLAMLFICLVGCAALPPTSGGVFRHGECSVRWQPQDFPLEVVVDDRLSGERQQALQEAILFWNEEVGETVFTIERTVHWLDVPFLARPHGTVFVLEGDIPDMSPPEITQGWATLSYVDDFPCQINDALIVIDLAVSPGDASIVIRHELGHALGLSHDGWQRSIMYRHASDSGGRVMPDDRHFIQWEMTND